MSDVGHIGDDANDAARVRVRRAVHQLASLNILGCDGAELRYCLEYQSSLIEVMLQALIDAGIVEPEAFAAGLTRALEARAGVLEARIHAWLYDRKEMPN